MGKNNRKKQGSFFQSLFQVPSLNIRDFQASSTEEEAFCLLFECQGKFPATFILFVIFGWEMTHNAHFLAHTLFFYRFAGKNFKQLTPSTTPII